MDHACFHTLAIPIRLVLNSVCSHYIFSYLVGCQLNFMIAIAQNCTRDHVGRSQLGLLSRERSLALSDSSPKADYLRR
jgi:hypothetical protein